MRKFTFVILIILFCSTTFALPRRMAKRHRVQIAEQKHRHKMQIYDVRHQGKIVAMRAYNNRRV